MATPDAATLLPLAESIADGTAIDWDAVAASASPDERAVIHQLRVLSGVAGLHRSFHAAAAQPGGPSAGRRQATAPAIGNWGHLVLVERIGGGAYGEVYRAWDPQLERDVALKLLRSDEPVDDLGASRIAVEGRLVARVRHANVITVFGVAAHDQRVGLWMELVRGATLEQRLREHGPFSAREATIVGIDLCRALAAIHAAGLIHRDVKAQNVMREDGGRIVLMDLGTGRDSYCGGGPPPSDLAGTPFYLAPEILAGGPASPRTDLYCLGVLLYHLVTGAFPVRATTIEELQEGHAKSAGVPLRDARADLPTAFVQVIERAIAPDPASRYASAGAFEADLLRALDASDVEPVREPRLFDKAVPASTKRRVVVWLGGVLVAAATVTLLALAVPAFRGGVAHPRLRLASRDAILVADFANHTGEQVFDGALKEALTVQLQQSPYVNALGPANIEAGLRMMGRSGDTPLAGPVGRELCERQRAKAMILGSITSLTSDHYLISVEAQNCQTGEVVGQGRAEATSRPGVLGALGVAATGLRETLGESLPSMQRFNVPVEEATTGSLDALKAYSVGMETRARVGDAEAIPFFNHALELDPRFALAEGQLASIYANLHEQEKSRFHTERAFELGDHVTERERLYIRASYHMHVTGRLDEAVGAYRLFSELYPGDWLPHNNLAAVRYDLGQFEDSLTEANLARVVNPDQVIPYVQMALTYLAMGRFAESRETLVLAQSRGLDAAASRAVLLELALIEHGVGAVRAEFASAPSRSKDAPVFAAAARAEAFGGNFRAARGLLAQAVAKARSGQIDDFASSLIAEDALNAALAGEAAYAHQAVDRALTIGRGSETLWHASLALALSGRRRDAASLTEEYMRVTPPTPTVVEVYGPVLRAANAVAAGQHQRALEGLQPALSYERVGRFWPVYLRGLAYAGLQQPREAAVQFQTIVSHREDAPTSVLFPLASLQLGRARRAARDADGARAAYDAFLAAWSEAPRDQPLVMTAIRERSTLSR